MNRIADNKPRPEVQRWSKKFWESTKQGKLSVQKCMDCQQYIFPPRLVCPNCLSENVEWVVISGRGKVWTFAALEPAGVPRLFKDDFPYVPALIELEEGVRMASHMIQCDPTDVYIGMPVEVVFEKLDDEFTLPKFKPLIK